MLTRHAALAAHKMAMEIPSLQQHMETVEKRFLQKQDKAVTALLKIIKWMANEDLLFRKFKSLINLMHEMGVADLDILKNRTLHYDSYFTASELLDSLAKVVEMDIEEKIEKSPVVTILANESTDIVNVK